MSDSAPALCANPVTHAVQLQPHGGWYNVCEACIAIAREKFPDTVNVRPAADPSARCIVPGVNA